MAPEICTPPPELSSFESDVWSYGCIILETTSGREPWSDQFNDDTNLFLVLQRKENAPLFARICGNQSGPPHICQLLVQCCTWSKTNRPRFTDIVNCLKASCERTSFSEDSSSQMSVDPLSISSDSSYYNDDYTKGHKSSNYVEDENRKGVQEFLSSYYEECNDNTKKMLPKQNKNQGRLTGETYTSRGNASGRPIYEGVRGGRYYLTDSGSKVYLHK